MNLRPLYPTTFTPVLDPDRAHWWQRRWIVWYEHSAAVTRGYTRIGTTRSMHRALLWSRGRVTCSPSEPR